MVRHCVNASLRQRVAGADPQGPNHLERPDAGTIVAAGAAPANKAGLTQ